MESVSLQLQGTGDRQLLAMVLGAVVLILIGTGAVRLARRRWYEGLLCLSAATGPAGLAAVLLGAAGLRYRSGRGGWAAPLVGAAVIAAATGLAAAAYVFAGRPAMMGWMLALGLEVALAVGVFYASVYSHLGPRRLGVLMALRWLAIAALLVILFKPALSFLAAAGSKPNLPIVLDRSGSMFAVDEEGGATRFAQATGQLSYQRKRIERSFSPAWSHFARSLQLSPSLESLAATGGEGGDQTDIASAIRQAANEFGRGDIPGILLITDGIHNAPSSVESAVVEAGVPIFVAGVGSRARSAAAGRNLRIASADAPLEAVKNNVSTITVRAAGVNLASPAVECKLLEEGSDVPLALERKSLDPKTQEATFELKWTPSDRAGAAASQPSRGELRKLRAVLTPQAGEQTGSDNAADLHVLVSEPKLRVLYVEGTMRPEYKDLKRFLETDSNVQFVGMVQVQKGRFWSQGSIDGRKLAGLPVTDADFGLFDVIILGDLDRSYLTNEQIDRFAGFVNKGGGLLMLGGHNSFGPGGYGGTKLEDALPVVMGGRDQPQETTPFLPRLTATGEASPIFEGITGFFPGPANRKADSHLPSLPQLLGCVTAVGAKNNASVLAVHDSRSGARGPLVVLATQNYGAGRSAAFTADTTWQWNRPLHGMGKDSPYQRFWGQMVRWLGNSDAKSRDQSTHVLLRADGQNLQLGQPLGAVAMVQDNRPSGEGSLSVSCSAIPDDPKLATEPIALAQRQDKLYEAQWLPTHEGKYRLKVTAVSSRGATLATDELPVTIAPHSGEMDRLERNNDLLEKIAQKSGGAYMDLSRLPELVDEIARRQSARIAPAPQGRDVRLYSFTWLFVAFALLVTGEWLLRRHWQLH